MIVAAAAYGVSAHADFSSFLAKLRGLAAAAAEQGAQLLLLPEYHAMELATIFAEPIKSDLQAQLSALQTIVPQYEAALSELARAFQLCIVGGTLPVQDADGQFRNRCTIATADGRRHHQYKLNMTRFERESWGVSAGQGQLVVDLGACRLGVAICYDSEFPVLVRELVKDGANLICVPSCTDSMHGYHRVEVACRARALENQCYVLVTHTIGDLPSSPAIDENHGAAALYGPPDRGFPANGVIAQTEIDAPTLLIAELDFDKVDAVRQDGQVLNHRDWR
ncbi:amidohydrolase [Ahniella affigens]|uniref:Amidohydrolase n=1 Tax=Ahniella affigens TaxID=2021234 RepID=A0A2P1PTN9_9GAMM|nr:carbon-nitrogen hydrolase family protein [Ahniella affigens]AVP98192.1 amidohydrolase [Ahniella affigens]